MRLNDDDRRMEEDDNVQGLVTGDSNDEGFYKMLSAMSGMTMRLFGNVEEFITTTR
jgi:hypothetical protein